jgi:hypothetical protein
MVYAELGARELGGAVVFSPIRCISINWEGRGFDG